MRDIQFQVDEKKFNCRVIGICIKENKIFLSKMKTDDYWTFVGGKVAFGESTDMAILREYKEEIGVHLQTDKLLAVIENFFELEGDDWHQYIFFYQLRDDNNVLEFFEGERQIADEENAVYKWFDLSQLEEVKIKPDCAKTVLKNMSQNVQHHINRDYSKKNVIHIFGAAGSGTTTLGKRIAEELGYKLLMNTYDNEFWNALDQLIEKAEIVIDRPKGTAHPKFPDFIYKVDYGYLQNTSSMDGEGIDVWVGTGEKKIDAIMCIVDVMKKDSEIKILLGCTEEEKEVVYATHNETPYMKGILLRR